jgi:hypothetical protein
MVEILGESFMDCAIPPLLNPCGFPAPAVDGIIGWWDTSCAATVTTITISSNPNNLASIADSSGNGNGMVKFGSNYPQFTTTMFNTSYPGVLITATDLGCMHCPNPFPMGAGSTLTAWYVGTMSGAGGGAFGRTLSYAKPGGSDFNNVNSWCVLANGSGTTVNFVRNNLGTLISSSGSGFPAGHRFIFTVNSSGVMTIYIDGVASGTVTVAGNWIDGGTMLFGGEPGASPGGFWRGIAGEWGVASSFTGSTGVAALDLYLKYKWGL